VSVGALSRPCRRRLDGLGRLRSLSSGVRAATVETARVARFGCIGEVGVRRHGFASLRGVLLAHKTVGNVDVLGVADVCVAVRHRKLYRL